MGDDLAAHIRAIEDVLDEAGRECLRIIVSRNLTLAEVRLLSKFMFGCMNQRHEIARRVDQRGMGELAKILEFVARTYSAIHEIDVRLTRSRE